VRRGCNGVPIDGDPCLLDKDVTKRGRSSCAGKWGDGVTSLSSPSSCSSSSSPPEDLGSEGVSYSLCPCRRLGDTPGPSFLPLCLQSFTVDTVGLLPCGILR
jgi:hypothetical protein